MANSRNVVHLVGHLGKDVEVQVFDSGSKKASFSLATSSYYKNNNGELVTNTQWHNIVAWNKSADFVSSVGKGEQLAVTGSINYRSYKDKNGETRYLTEILLDTFSRLSKKEDPNRPSNDTSSDN